MSAELIPNTEEWLAERKNYLGGSDAPAAMGMSHWRSPRKVWESKLPDYVEPEQSAAMKRGHVLEAPVALAYTHITGQKLEQSQHVVDSDNSFMACTPDRFISGMKKHIQIKTHSSWVKHDYGESYTDEFPEAEYVQCIHELIVTGNDECDLVVLLADDSVMDLMVKMLDSGEVTEETVSHYIEQMDLRIYTIGRDYEFEQILISAERDFWENYVMTGVEPTDITQATPGKKDCREATEREAKAISVMKKHWFALERAKLRIDKKSAEIQDMIGTDYGIIISETGEKVTWGEPAKRTTTDWKAIAEQYMPADKANEIIGRHTKTTTGKRPFRVPITKWKKEM